MKTDRLEWKIWTWKSKKSVIFYLPVWKSLLIVSVLHGFSSWLSSVLFSLTTVYPCWTDLIHIFILIYPICCVLVSVVNWCSSFIPGTSMFICKIVDSYAFWTMRKWNNSSWVVLKISDDDTFFVRSVNLNHLCTFMVTPPGCV